MKYIKNVLRKQECYQDIELGGRRQSRCKKKKKKRKAQYLSLAFEAFLLQVTDFKKKICGWDPEQQSYQESHDVRERKSKVRGPLGWGVLINDPGFLIHIQEKTWTVETEEASHITSWWIIKESYPRVTACRRKGRAPLEENNFFMSLKLLLQFFISTI